MIKKLSYSFIIAIASLFASLDVWAQTAGFTVSSIAVCADNPVITFTNTSTNDVSWAWDFDLSDGIQVQSILENPTWFFASSGTYTVTLTAYDGVNQTGNSNQFTMTITIWALPIAGFSVVNTAEGCAPFEVCFNDQSIEGDAAINAWLWTFGDGGSASGSNPCYTYLATSVGTWSVSLQVVDANGCSDTAIISNLIIVHATPTANFSFATLAGNLVGCHPTDTIQFTDISDTAETSIISWEWDFGDANTGTGPNPIHSYNASGNFNVQLIITDDNGCKDTINKFVQIDNYQASFTANLTTGCDELLVIFTDATSSILAPNQFLWDFGDPSNPPNTSTTNPSFHLYSSPGQYSVTLTSTNAYGCSDDTTIINIITVFPLPQVGFFADPLYTCDVPFDVIFTDTTPSAPPGCGTCSWVWDVDNWNPFALPPNYDWSSDYNAETFTHTYIDSISPVCPPLFTRIDYNVSVIVTDSNGCVDSLVKDIYISSTEPIAAFIADTSDFLGARSAEGCIPLRVHFKDISTYDTSVVPNDSIVNWYWDFGDGYTISGPDGPIPDSANDCLTSCTYRNPTHFYVDTGFFFVTLAITTASGCTDTIRMYENCECDPMTGKICVVLAGMPPVVEFTADDTTDCFPFEVNFFDLSSSFANSWYWDFGDGGTSTDQDPTYTYSSETGYFDVSLAASFYGCPSDTLVKDSMIYVDFPQALFNIAPISGDGAGILLSPSTFFCHEDTLPTGGWEASIRDTTVGANSGLDSSFLWVFNFGDPLASTFESVDTTIIIVHDTVFVLADTIIVPEDTIFFRAGDTTLFSVVCDSGYFIIIPADTLYLDADTIDTPNDTIRMIGDYMIWMGMSTDTIIVMPDITITTYTYKIIPPEDTIIDSTFTIYMMSETTFITADTIFGCDTNFTLADSTIFEPTYTVVTTIGADTLYYIPHDSVGIATAMTFFQPDTVFYVSRDTIVYVSADTVIIGSDTLVLAIDTIIIDTVAIFVPADTFFVGIDTIPADTTITPADTNWTDPSFSPIDTILLGGIGGCDTLFVVNDSIITPADTTIIPEFYLAKLLKHTYMTTPGTPAFYPSAPGTNYEVKLYAYNSITGCLDSISNFVYISSVNAGFSINAPFGGDTLGCLPFNAFIQDSTTTIYDIVMRHWNFGDGCTLTTYFPFLDIPVPPDSTCGGLTSGNTGSTPPGAGTNHRYDTAGTYTITMLVVDQFGCRDSISRQVVVKDLPVSFFAADTTTGCANDPLLADLEVTFSDLSSVFQPAQTVQWVWDYDGLGPNPPDTTYIPVSNTYTYTTAGTFFATLIIIDEFGCESNPQLIPITTTFPTPNFAFSPSTICNGTQVLFGSSCSSCAAPLTYYWDWCDNSAVDVTTNASQTHTFINLDTTSTGQDTTTIFNVTLTIEDVNGCMQDTTLPITIQQPVADFYSVIADIDSICPNVFSFFDSSSTDVTSWNWDFGDGNTSVLQNPTNNYSQPGEYDVQLIVSNSAGCIDTIIKLRYIIIKGPILIDTSMIANCTCAPCTVSFTAVGYNTDIFTWFFGDGGDTSVVVNAIPGNPDTVTVTITYVYQQSGTFYPVLRLEDPLDSAGQRCPYNHFLPPVTILGPIIDFFTNDTVCGPRDVIFDTINTSGTSVITSWEWNFDVTGIGGVSPSTSNQASPPDVNYSNPGSYTISLTAYFDTCSVKVTKENYITVFEIPFTPIEFCPDSTITFSVDTSIIPLSIDSLVWSFEGDGSETGDSVEHTYTRHDSIVAVAYDVTLALYNNGINVCTYVFPDYVTVYPTPTAIFYIDPVVSGVQTSISFIDSSIDATSWEWDFGDGSPVIGPGGSGIDGINPSGTYDNPFYSYDVPYGENQSFIITLTVYNDLGCSDTATVEKTIELKIPNVFAPGSDKPQNAVFFIGALFLDTLDLSDATLKLIVFNRWGQKVYENDHYEECDPWNAAEKCWDGTDLKGKPLNTDTYYYVLNFNERSIVNGWVMIWRPE